MSNTIHNNKLMLSANKDNVERVPWPYYWLGSASNSGQGNWAVFLGTDFHTMTEVDTELFIKKTNQCLDYVRKNCPDCRLIYRIHPDEKKETKLLDLRLFIVEKDGQMAEDFLWANRERVKYVFSVCSSASVSAFNMGLNSYCYYNYFKDVFKGEYKLFLVHFLSGLPTSFFIDNMDSPLLDNKIKLEEDKQLKNSFETILKENNGPVWFIVTENRYLLAILGLTRMIRMISPERKVNLIISRHHRWTDEKLNELKNIFDKIITFPRTFYSLKPQKLVSALITAKKIKRRWSAAWRRDIVIPRLPDGSAPSRKILDW